MESLCRGQEATAEMIIGLYDQPPVHRWTMDKFRSVMAWPQGQAHGSGSGAAGTSGGQGDDQDDDEDFEDAQEDEDDDDSDEDLR